MTYISDATPAHQAVLAAKCVLLAIPYQYIRERVAGSLLLASFGPLKLNTLQLYGVPYFGAPGRGSGASTNERDRRLRMLKYSCGYNVWTGCPRHSSQTCLGPRRPLYGTDSKCIVAAPPLAATPALSARVAHGLLLAFLLPGLRSEYSGPSTGHWAFFGRPTCG